MEPQDTQGARDIHVVRGHRGKQDLYTELENIHELRRHT